VLTSIIGYPEADEAPRNFFRLRNGDDYNTVFDRFLLFLEKLFIAVKCEVEKLPTQADTPLPVLWYNRLLQGGDQTTRQNIYEEVVTATEASRVDDHGINGINRCVELP
jgi:hypothetical protein